MKLGVQSLRLRYNLFLVIFFMLSIFLFYSCATTSDKQVASGSQGVTGNSSPEKFAAFQKMIKAVGAEAQYKEVISLVMNQVKNSMTISIAQKIARNDKLTEDQKTQARLAFQKQMGEALTTLQKRLQEGIPFSDLVKNVYYPVYEKYFSISEIKEITAFYEGKTGKKFVSLSPKLMQESMTLMNSLYQTKIRNIVRSVIKEQLNKIKKERIKKIKSGSKNI